MYIYAKNSWKIFHNFAPNITYISRKSMHNLQIGIVKLQGNVQLNQMKEFSIDVQTYW